MSTLPFVKGHGTGNDFVLLPDPDGALDLTPELVVALADRRTGLGADGVIRVVRSAALGDGADGAAGLGAAAHAAGAEWFMDHHNADGTLAEMCGNGVRVLVEHLAAEGLVPPAALIAGVAVGTRAGTKIVRRVSGPGGEPWWSVEMGPWRLAAPDAAAESGADALVAVAGLGVARPALSVDMGNPHTVVVLAGEEELVAADLSMAPVVDPVPPEGSNVELVSGVDASMSGGHEVGRLRMRVHERGVGETRSCGTGVCAAAVAARVWAGGLGVGPGSTRDGIAVPDEWLVQVPGGTLAVTLLPGQQVVLSGPAMLLARGVVDVAHLG